MHITFKARLRAGMAVAALVPAMAFASTISVNGAADDDRPGASVVASPVTPTTDFLSWATRPLSGPAVVPGTSVRVDSGVTVFVPPAVVLRNPLSANLRGGSDLALWNFVAAVHAQQRSDAFEWVEASVAAQPLAQPTADPLSVVPLPPAVWLFVMGVLGLAGTRVTGLSGANRRSAGEGAARGLTNPAWGGALPA